MYRWGENVINLSSQVGLLEHEIMKYENGYVHILRRDVSFNRASTG